MKNLLHKIEEVPKDKKLIVFDLDGTLVETKSTLDEEMAGLLCQLLGSKLVAVISGGKYEVFQDIILDRLHCLKEQLKNLFLFPTTATAFYRYEDGWRQVYLKEISKEHKTDIKNALKTAFQEVGYKEPDKVYGETLEDRKSQVTYSFLGQDIVKVLGEEGVRLKKEWRDRHTDLKMKLAKILQRLLPDLEVRAAGYTSIDITQKGIDKEFGLKQMEKYLETPFWDMLFVGDAFFPGGNDSAVLRTGVICFEVEEIEDTKKLIRYLLED